MPKDSSSRSEVWGAFRNLGARLDFLDTKVVEALSGGAAGVLDVHDIPFPAYGQATDSFTGFPTWSQFGPTVLSPYESTSETPFVTPFPGLNPLTGPVLITNSDLICVLTGSVMANADVDLSLPMLSLPEWAAAGFGVSTLSDCDAWRLRWAYWDDDTSGWVVVRTDDRVPGLVYESDGTWFVGLDDPADDVGAPPDEADTLIVDFGVSSWPPAGSPQDGPNLYYSNDNIATVPIRQGGADISLAAGSVYGTVNTTRQSWVVNATITFDLQITVATPGSGDTHLDVYALFQALDERWSGWAWGWGGGIKDLRAYGLHGTLGGQPWHGSVDRNGSYLRDMDGQIVSDVLQTGDNIHGTITGLFQND